MPFILRGVTLYGINSVFVANEQRRQGWALLAQHVDARKFEAITQEIGLSEVIAFCPQVLAGKVRGRTVVAVGR
jgi:acrylyl-CoA reductase (NADPH)